MNLCLRVYLLKYLLQITFFWHYLDFLNLRIYILKCLLLLSFGHYVIDIL